VFQTIEQQDLKKYLGGYYSELWGGKLVFVSGEHVATTVFLVEAAEDLLRTDPELYEIAANESILFYDISIAQALRNCSTRAQLKKIYSEHGVIRQ
jgi:hypothetical protein